MALVAVLAVVVAGGSSATAVAASGTGEVAQASAKQGAKGKAKGKQKARSCTKAKRGKGRKGGKVRRSVAQAQAQASAKKGKGKGRAKRCATRRAAPKKRGDDGRRPSSDPRERRREREEAKGRRRPTAPKPTAPARLAPADGSYTAAAVPGLTFTISDGGTRGRIAYTVPKGDFDGSVCQTDDVPVSVPIELSRSDDGRSGFVGSQQLPGGSASVLGSVARDGAFVVTISTNRPYAPDPTATCSASSRLAGTLAR